MGIGEAVEVFAGNASYYEHADGLGSITGLNRSHGGLPMESGPSVLTRNVSRRSLFYVLFFAVGGFLLTGWDLALRFAPIPWSWFLVRNLLHTSCFDWPTVASVGWLGQPLALEGPVNAVVYGVIGWVVGRAFRRIPASSAEDRSPKLVKRFVICSAVVGFGIAAWYHMFRFAPVIYPARYALDLFCISCKWGYDNGTPSVGVSFAVLLLWGPMNASFLGMVGWVIGRALRRLPPNPPAPR